MRLNLKYIYIHIMYNKAFFNYYRIFLHNWTSIIKYYKLYIIKYVSTNKLIIISILTIYLFKINFLTTKSFLIIYLKIYFAKIHIKNCN